MAHQGNESTLSMWTCKPLERCFTQIQPSPFISSTTPMWWSSCPSWSIKRWGWNLPGQLPTGSPLLAKAELTTKSETKTNRIMSRNRLFIFSILLYQKDGMFRLVVSLSYSGKYKTILLHICLIYISKIDCIVARSFGTTHLPGWIP